MSRRADPTSFEPRRPANAANCPASITLLAAAIEVLAAAPVNAAQDAAAHPPAPTQRIIRKEATVAGTVDDAWAAWTTQAGVASFFSPDSRIELKLGGAYELYMGMTEPDASGLRGSEGCRVLSYVPRSMLAFEWNFPPAVPTLRNARAKTFVVVRFDSAGQGRTRVRLTQLGWQEGQDWDAGYAYFDRAWGKVLEWLTAARQEGRTPAAAPLATAESKSWMDGEIRVTAVRGPEKRQEFELVLPVPVERTWHLLATTEGLRELGGKDPLVELTPGGRYAFWPDSNNRVLAHVPFEMLSVSGSAPPRFPNVQKGGTWSAYTFEPADGGGTRVRLVSLGWKSGEQEWDDAFEYFLKNNPVFLKHVAAVAAEKK